MVCTNCKKDKPNDEFYMRSNKKSLETSCKTCQMSKRLSPSDNVKNGLIYKLGTNLVIRLVRY